MASLRWDARFAHPATRRHARRCRSCRSGRFTSPASSLRKRSRACRISGNGCGSEPGERPQRDARSHGRGRAWRAVSGSRGSRSSFFCCSRQLARRGEPQAFDSPPPPGRVVQAPGSRSTVHSPRSLTSASGSGRRCRDRTSGRRAGPHLRERPEPRATRSATASNVPGSLLDALLASPPRSTTRRLLAAPWRHAPRMRSASFQSVPPTELHG